MLRSIFGFIPPSILPDGKAGKNKTSYGANCRAMLPSPHLYSTNNEPQKDNILTKFNLVKAVGKRLLE
ncbi:MAG: hypothetical protein M0P61_09015 [Ignavibacteriaceae bacterium]|jgi:hypothetical protein|nr:hypothetical protein [Ignavibacteriaceae bacterium]